MTLRPVTLTELQWRQRRIHWCQLKWEPAPHTAIPAELRIPWKIQTCSSSQVPMDRENFSAMSITHQLYQEHPLLTNHTESGNLQGSSSMCWQKQTDPKGWILEEAHGGASTHQARIFRSHSAGRAFLILVFGKLFAQKHAFNAELSVRPWTQRQGEENISEFLPYPWWEYQLPLKNHLFTKQLLRLIHTRRKLHSSRGYLKLVLTHWTAKLIICPLKNGILLNA